MLNDTQVYKTLDTTLSADIRPTVMRRLRRVPALWSALHEEAFLKKAVSFAGTDPARWRPGFLGLLLASETEYLRARFAQANVSSHNISDASLARAEQALQAIGTTPNPSLDQAALAALGLAKNGAGKSVSPALPADANLVWDCWYSIAPDPKTVLIRLAESLPADAGTLLEVLLTNEDIDRTVEICESVLLPHTFAAVAALCDAASNLGEDALARRLAAMATRKSAGSPAASDDPATRTAQAKLLRLSGEPSAALPVADAARQNAKKLLQESMVESALDAEEEKNFTAALTFWQEAGAITRNASGVRSGIARSLSGLGRHEEALAALPSTAEEPEDLLILARLRQKMGSKEKALEAARQACAKCSPDSNPRLALQIAGTLADCGDFRGAALVQNAAVKSWPWNAAALSRLADLSAQLKEWGACHQAAAAAWQLDPEDTSALALLGQSALLEGRPAEAVNYYRTLTSKLPNDPKSFLQLAQAELAAGGHKGAKEAAEHALVQDGSIGEAHAVLGQIALAEGSVEAAFASLQKATRLSPAATAPWKALAELHAAKGNRDAALTTLRAGAESAANPSELFLTLGRMLNESGLLREAASTLERAAGLNDGDADILVALAEAYLGLNRAPDAENCLNRALALSPALVPAVRRLATLLKQSGRSGEARTILERALAADPQSVDLMIELGSLLLHLYQSGSQSDSSLVPAALSTLRQAAELSGEKSDLQLQSLLGWASVYSGTFADAICLFSTLLQKGGELTTEQKADAFRGLAEALMGSGDFATAISNLQSALQLVPGNPALRQRLGEALTSAGLNEDAQEVFRMILADIPDDIPALSGLANVLIALNRVDEAISLFRQATELSPKNPDVWIRLAEAHLQSGNEKQARAALSQAMQFAVAQQADIPLRAGRLLGVIKDYAEAEAIFEQALAQNPKHVGLITELGKALQNSGKHGKAFDAFRRASELQPDNADHLRNAADALWNDGRKSAALAFLKKAVQVDSKNIGLIRNLASGLIKVGLAKDSLPYYEQAIALAPSDSSLSLEAARAAFRAGDLEKADAWKESGANAENDPAESLVLKARIALEKGKLEKAVAESNRLVSSHPDDARGWAILAQALATQSVETKKTGKAKESPVPNATAALRKAVALCGEESESLGLTGRACLLLEDYSNAVRCLDSLCQITPDDPDAHTLLAQAAITRAEALYRSQLAGAGEDWAQAVSTHAADSVRSALARAAALGETEETLQPLLARATLAFSHPDAESISSLEAVSDENPTAESLLAIAQAWLRAGDETKARKAAETAVNLQPNLPAARILLGICEWKIGKRETALVTLREAAEAAPHLPLSHALAATILNELDRRAEARVKMQQAVHASPETAAWQHTLGRWNEEAGDISAALPYLQRAVDLNPKNGEYHLHLARALQRDGDPQNAFTHFQTAVSVLSEITGQLQAEMGKAAIEANQPSEAYAAFTAAQEQAGSAAPYEWALGRARAALALGRRAEARTLAKAVLDGNARPPEAHLILAEVDESEDKLQDAIRHLDHAAVEMNDPVLPALRLAKLWNATGSAPRSVLAMQALVEASPENDEAQHLLAESLVLSGRMEEGLRASQKAVQLAPRRASHWMLQGRIARMLGQLDQSLAALTKAREIAPSDWRTGLECGLTYEAEQRWDLALEVYRAALQLAPDCAELHYRLGVVHKNLRSYAEAAGALRKAVQIEPQNLAAHKLLSGVMALSLVYGAHAQPLETR